MKTLLVLLTVAIITSLAACGSMMSDAERSIANAHAGYVITGRVMRDSAGLAEAAVVLRNEQAETTVTVDSDGYFRFKDVKAGAYTVQARHDNYTFEPYTQELNITALPKETLLFSALPAYSVSGSVAGESVAGVTVTIKNERSTRTAITDASGAFSAPDVPAGSFTVTLAKDAELFCPGEMTIEVKDAAVSGLVFTNGFIAFEKTFGNAYQDSINAIIITHDGGLVAVGVTSSIEKKKDMYVARLNGRGDILWQQSIGGSLDDVAYAVVEDAGHNLVIVGETTSFGAGGSDMWVVKLDSAGNYLWDKTFGGAGSEKARGIALSSQGYMIAGRQYATGATDSNASVVHIDQAGNTIWERVYGGNRNDEAYAIQGAADGSFVIAGYTNLHVSGENDAWLFKIEPGKGDVIWSRQYGGDGIDEAYSLALTSDGGYVLSGSATTESVGGSDMYVVRVDQNGILLWENRYGTSASEKAEGIALFANGAIVIAGTRTSGPSATDGLMLTLDSQGVKQGERLYGDSVGDAFHAVIARGASGIVAAGEKTGQSADMWLMSAQTGGNK